MRALLNSFTAGLLDETLVGRVDLPNLTRGAQVLRNFLPRVTGGLVRRPGTVYHGTLRGECRLIPFNFSREQRFQLEAGEGYLRVWKDGVRMATEYAAPWTAATIHRWHFVQVNDVCFLCDRDNEPLILTRRADDDWLLENWNDRIVSEPNGWPAMRDENATATTLTASAKTGTGITLTASADTFALTDVGGFYELAHRLDVPTVEVSLSDGSGVASGVLTFTAVAVAGEQFSVGAGADLRVYTWVASNPGINQVVLGAAAADSAAAAIKAINGDVDAVVGTGTLAHPSVTARSGGTFASGIKATGRLTFTDNDLTDGTDDEFTITGPTHDRTYVFKDTLTGAAYEVKKGATLADSITNALKAIGNLGTAGVHYGTGTVAHADVTAALSVAPNAIDVTAAVAGLAGNDIETTVQFTSRMSWGAATLTNGEDSSSAKVIVEAIEPGTPGNGIPLSVTTGATWGSWNAVATAGGVTVPQLPETLRVSDELRVNGGYEVVTHGEWWGPLLLEMQNASGSWETLRSWSSKNDTNVSATGTQDGEAAMRLRFVGSGTDARAELRMTDSLIRGLVRITGFTDAQHVTGDVVRDIYATTATARWSENAWSARRGWPRALVLFEQALCLAGNYAEPQKVWSSGKGDFFNFRRDGLSDSAWSYQIAGQESSPVAWLAATSFGLVVGTEKEEWLLTGGADSPITPTTTPQSRRHTAYGAAGIQVGMAGPAMLFVQDGGRNLLEYIWDDTIRGFVAPDLSELVEGIMVSKIRQLAWQRAPFYAVWVVMEDGRLFSMTYRREKEVVAWAEHPMNGATVESVCVTNGDNGLDEVWLAIKRTVDGATVRYLERIDSGTHLALMGNDRDGLTYLDCSKRATAASPTTVFSGFDHLEGELVQVTADNAVQPDARVTGGIINLQREASAILAGVGYRSELKPMPIEATMQDGTAQGRRFSLTHMAVRYWRTTAATYEVSGRAPWAEVFRTGLSVADAPPELFTGVKRVAMAAGYGDSVEWSISTSDAEPLNLLWATPVFNVHGQ